MKDWKQTSTRKAFAIHLVLSLLIFSTLVFTMLVFWFPGKLFYLDGGWQGLKIVALIDIVLGPAMTLFLFKPGKKSLVFDMSVIASIQIAALVFGFYTTYQQRTVAIVFSHEGFSTVSATAHKEANEQLLQKSKEPSLVSEFDAGRPALLSTPLPNADNFGKFMADLLNGLPEPHERSDRYSLLKDHSEEVAKRSHNAEALDVLPHAEAIYAALEKHDRSLNDTEVVPFKTRYASGELLFDPLNVKIIDYIPKPKAAATSTAELGDN
ncbi:MAG: hypothetical protein KTR35_05745 [Gammaproteobacteria bacterium]|nr:hypothetical protein [Gammaproteobacteria bacterium]